MCNGARKTQRGRSAIFSAAAWSLRSDRAPPRSTFPTRWVIRRRRNTFAHESGIHQEGMLKHVETYEIMRPEEVGVKETSLVLGKLSGRHAFRDKLAGLGYELDAPALEDAFRRFKELADKKKQVFDEDILALVDDEVVRGHDGIVVKALRVETGLGVEPRAKITLATAGEERRATTTGDGPVD